MGDEIQPMKSKSRKGMAAQAGQHEREDPRAGTSQAEMEGKNGARFKEIWSVTLAARAAPVTQWSSTRAWELALLVAASSQVAHICDIGVSNVCQHPTDGYLQLIDAGAWISHNANPRWPSKSRASGSRSLLTRHQPEVAAVIKSALVAAGPWGDRQFIPAITGALITREPQVQTLLAACTPARVRCPAS